jgi:glutamyl-tRNA reductase
LLHNIGLGFTLSESSDYNLSSETEEEEECFSTEDEEDIIKEELQSGMTSTINKVMEQTGHAVQDILSETNDENAKEMGKVLSSIMSGQEPDKEVMERLTQNIFNSIMQKQ